MGSVLVAWMGHRPGGNLVSGKQGGCEMLARSLALAVDTGGDGRLGSFLPKDDCLSPILPREAACTESEHVPQNRLLQNFLSCPGPAPGEKLVVE